MIARLTRIVGSLAMMLVAYWVYAFTAVPLIEPVAERRNLSRTRDADFGEAGQQVANQREDLKHWFSERDWERASPKILETPQGILILNSYRPIEDGRRVKIEPCSMVFLPEGKFADESERRRRAIVLRAPQGAILKFDKKFDLKQAKIGKLIGGDLIGPITIFSQQRSLGPEDDLLIVTRDVRLTETQITTPSPIDFRIGPNSGRGRGLLVKMNPAAEKKEQMALGAITSFELTHDITMSIQPGGVDLFPGMSKKSPSDTDELPVEVSCQGPFTFDLAKYVASFRKQVSVLRLNPDGPSDQITCELFSLYFDAERAARTDSPSGDPSKQPPKLRPTRISALGNPVVVNSPSNLIVAQGEQLDYDLLTRAGNLIGREHDVMLRQEARGKRQSQEIHAHELYFEPDELGKPRKLLASGAGWLRGDMPGGDGQITARWTESLHFRPDEENKVLSVRGRAQLQLGKQGELEADEVHLWLVEVPAESAPKEARPATTLSPARLLAITRDTPASRTRKPWNESQRHVRINTPQLTGTADQLKVWFERPAPAQPGDAGPPANVEQQPAPQPVAKSSPTDSPGQRFDVRGESLQLRVLLSEPNPRLSEVVIDRGQEDRAPEVRCTETRTAVAGEKPLILTGDRLHLTQPSPAEATVSVQGKPARVKARGMVLAGGKINLHRGSNKMWIAGPGSVSFPAAAAGVARETEESQEIDITWTDRMEFNGRRARFTGRKMGVTARQAGWLLRTSTLEVTLTRKVDFAANNAKQEPKVDFVRCRGPVYMENRRESEGQLASVERMGGHDLQLEQRSGELSADGPGWVTSIRKDPPGSQLRLPGQPKASKAPTAKTPPATGLLTYLNVDFDQALTGNVNQNSMVFHKQVRAVYGGVDNWEARLDADNPEQLGPSGFVLSCDRLGVDQTGHRTDPSYDFKATGNTRVEGDMYTALGSSATYSTAKEFLVLEGDGTTNARLFREGRFGAARDEASAARILYWHKTNRLEAEGARYLDLSNLTGFP